MTSDQNIVAEIKGLRVDMAALNHGLRQMLEIQEAHTAMLQRVLVASTPSPDADALLRSSVKQLIASLKHQHTLLGEVKSSIDHLPSHVGRAVSEAVGDVLTKL